MPDEVSKKSLKVLDQKLKLLAEHAEFQVNINSVLGSGVKNPEDALAVARRALELGFTSTVGILHDGNGQLKPLGQREREIFEEIMSLGKRSFSRINGFQHNIATGPRKQLALPLRLALSLHLRRRPGPLVLAAARLSRHSARGIHRSNTGTANISRKSMRAALHGFVCASDFGGG